MDMHKYLTAATQPPVFVLQIQAAAEQAQLRIHEQKKRTGPIPL
jgi:hypothetical protein